MGNLCGHVQLSSKYFSPPPVCRHAIVFLTAALRRTSYLTGSITHHNIQFTTKGRVTAPPLCGLEPILRQALALYYTIIRCIGKNYLDVSLRVSSAAISACCTLETSFPPAIALSGRPPPLPPAAIAAFFTIFPACAPISTA